MVDVLLLSASCGQLNLELVPTGHKNVTQVSFLSNALLSLKLLPLLEAMTTKTGVPSRLSWVGSRTQYRSSLYQKWLFKADEKILERMDDKAKYSGMTIYSDMKLLVAMFVAALGEPVSSEKVIVNTMCPGAVNTHISDVLPFPLRQVMNMINYFHARSLEVGARVIVDAAVVVGRESHGRFLFDKDVVE
jgi:NAD(P)-dependent dehydrogenase (short-subunit alcohol dehydrogenase family)